MPPLPYRAHGEPRIFGPFTLVESAERHPECASLGPGSEAASKEEACVVGPPVLTPASRRSAVFSQGDPLLRIPFTRRSSFTSLPRSSVNTGKFVKLPDTNYFISNDEFKKVSFSRRSDAARSVGSRFIFRGRIRQILEDGGPKPLNLKEKAMCKVIIQENARARHSDRDCRWRAMLKASGRNPHCSCFCHATAQLVSTAQTPLIRTQHVRHRWIVAAAQSNRTTLVSMFFFLTHTCALDNTLDRTHARV